MDPLKALFLFPYKLTRTNAIEKYFVVGNLRQAHCSSARVRRTNLPCRVVRDVVRMPLETHDARSHTIPFIILVIYILVKAVVMQHRVQVPVQPQLVQSALNKLAEAVREPALLVPRGARPRRAGARLCAKRDALGSAPSTL